MSNKLSEAELEQIKNLLKHGDKEKATSLYRQLTNAGIFETKDALKELESQLNIVGGAASKLAKKKPSFDNFDKNGFLDPKEEAVFDDISDIRVLCMNGELARARALYSRRKGVSLSEAKLAVDEIFSSINNKNGIEESNTAVFQSNQNIDSLILSGQRNQAIKNHMAQNMLSKEESSRIIYAREKELLNSSPDNFSLSNNNPEQNQPLSNTGPGAAFIFSMIILAIALGIWYFMLTR